MIKNYFLKFFLSVFFIFTAISHCQVINDDFEDGSISGWTEGTSSDWTNSTSSPITGLRSLKHNLSSTSGESYIYHDISSLDLSTQNISWQFNLANENWDPSSSNRFWVYLTANETDLSSYTVDGYAVGVNLTGSSDILTLYKVTNRSTVTAIVSSSLNWNSSDTVGVKVTRSSLGVWELFVDSNGGFDSLVSAGSGSNTDYTHDDYFGLFFDFTSSRAGKLRMDDVTVEGTVPSSDSPSISTSTSSISGLDYEFGNGPSTDQSFTVSGSNLTNNITLSAPSNFEISEFSGSGFGSSITLTHSSGSVSSTTIYARLASSLSVDSYSGVLSVSSSGTTSNISLAGEVTAIPTPGLIITEISDPNGSGSSDKRFIELFNSSNSSIDLTDYKIKKWVGGSSGNSYSETTLQGTLEAYSFYIIASNAATFKSTYGFAANQITSSVVSGNGDDSYALIYSSNGSKYDVYGSGDNTDGSNLSWEYEDGRAERASSNITASRTFNSSNWNIHNDSGGGDGAQTAPTDYDPGYWIGATSADTWNGLSTVDSYWETAENWASKSIPVSADNIFIREATNVPEITSNETTNISNLTIEIFATLSVSEGSSLSISGDYKNSGGTLTLKTGASMTVDGNSTGDITYTRSIGTTNWYLISSPVTGQDIDAFASASNLATGTQLNNMGLGDYNNSTNDWSYYQSGASGSGVFASGDARAIKLASAGDISFTGNIDVDDSGVGIAMTTSTNGYNLIGNPYPSYIAANNSGNATNNILKVNDTDNDYLTESTIWFFNQSTLSYDQINHASSAMHIAPGQGFFVSSNGSNSFSFTEAMQSNQSSDTFQRLSPRPEIELTLSDGSLIRNTDIFYIEGTTTGFDNGYDSTLFGGSTHSFEIYTHLVSDSQGQDFGIQSLPDNNFEDTVIPVGVNAVSGTDITISALASNLPAGISLFLEDKTDDSFTLLDEESNYSTTLESDAQGIGRYYLHTTSQSLDAASVALNNNISVYKSSGNNLRIVGVQSGMANIYLYNTIGKQVLKTSFMGSGVNDIELPELSRGVYIVKLSTLNGVFNKKIIID